MSTHEEEIAAATARAQEIFDELIEKEPRPILLWLCSYLRQWDFAAWNYTPDEIARGQAEASRIWNKFGQPN